MEPCPPAHAAGSGPVYSEPTGSGAACSGPVCSEPWTADPKNQLGCVENVSHVSGQSKESFIISQLPLGLACNTAITMNSQTKNIFQQTT